MEQFGLQKNLTVGAPLQYIAPYAGCAMAEYFREQGKDVLSCPLPIGIMPSIALIPVCRGTETLCRSIIPGASDSTGRVC